MQRIRPLLPRGSAFNVREADIYEGIEEREVDRLTLDLPEPWTVVDSAAESLAPGGIFLSFLPTTLQVHRLNGALQNHGAFQLVETVELMLRSWHVSEKSMRPDHRMVAHTDRSKVRAAAGSKQPLKRRLVGVGVASRGHL